MPETKPLCLKIDSATESTLETLAANRHTTKSALVRKLISIGLEKELAKESIDFVREQIHDEIKDTCFPQFERIAKLVAKIGYQSVSSFYLLSYIMDSILPASTKVEFEDTKRNSKAMAIAYLKLNEADFMEFMKSEDKALEMLELK